MGGSVHFGGFSFLLKNENRLPCFDAFFATAAAFAPFLPLLDIVSRSWCKKEWLVQYMCVFFSAPLSFDATINSNDRQHLDKSESQRSLPPNQVLLVKAVPATRMLSVTFVLWTNTTNATIFCFPPMSISFMLLVPISDTWYSLDDRITFFATMSASLSYNKSNYR